MLEVALGRVVDDVLEAHVDGLVAQLHREHLVGLVAQAVEELRVDRGRFFPDQAGERGAFRAVSLARRAEAAEQVHLQLRRLGEFVGRQFGGLLVEIVGDAHRTDRVRAGRARAHLVELVHGRQHRARALLHHVQVGGNGTAGAAGAAAPALRLLAAERFCSVSDRAQPFITAAAPIDGAAHDELPAVEAGRNFRRHLRVFYFLGHGSPDPFVLSCSTTRPARAHRNRARANPWHAATDRPGSILRIANAGSHRRGTGDVSASGGPNRVAEGIAGKRAQIGEISGAGGIDAGGTQRNGAVTASGRRPCLRRDGGTPARRRGPHLKW